MEAEPPEALAVRQLLREGDVPQTRRSACAARNIPESYKGRTRSLVMAKGAGEGTSTTSPTRAMRSAPNSPRAQPMKEFADTRAERSFTGFTFPRRMKSACQASTVREASLMLSTRERRPEREAPLWAIP
jgi:hypothetical protein